MILVTGGTGYIGRHVLAALTAAGHETRVLTRQENPGDLPGPVEAYRGDLLDPDGLARAFAGVSTVVHLAAAFEGPHLSDLNVKATTHLAEAARRHGARRFVHCSSAGVYGDGSDVAPHLETETLRPTTPYERSKVQGEHAVISTLGEYVPWVLLRPTGIYGPGRTATLDLLRRIERRQVWIHGPARVIVHPTYIDDVVAAIVVATEVTNIAGRAINVGGERALPYPALIDLAAQLLSVKARQFQMPPALGQTVRAFKRWGLLPRRFDRLASAIVNRAVDTGEATRLLELRPIPLEEGLRRTIVAFRRRGS